MIGNAEAIIQYLFQQEREKVLTNIKKSGIMPSVKRVQDFCRI